MLLAAFDHASRGGDHGPHFLFPLFLLILAGFLVGWFIKRRRGGGTHHHMRSAMHTLQDRFARGDIDQAEFDHRKAVLAGEEVIPPAPVGASAPPTGDDSDAADGEE